MTDNNNANLVRDDVKDFEIKMFEEILKLALSESQVRFLVHTARVVALTNMESVPRANTANAANANTSPATGNVSASAPATSTAANANATAAAVAASAPTAAAAIGAVSAPMGPATATLSPAHAAAATSIAAAAAAHAGPVQPAPVLTVMPVGFQYEMPAPTASPPYYAVTRGRRVGVMATWAYTSPFVTGVRGAAFVKVATIHEGRLLIDAALASQSVGIITG